MIVVIFPPTLGNSESLRRHVPAFAETLVALTENGHAFHSAAGVRLSAGTPKQTATPGSERSDDREVSGVQFHPHVAAVRRPDEL
jgi:hypothetical protein